MTSTRRWFVAVAVALVACTGVSVVGFQSYPPAFPRTNATKLLETDRIVVWDMVWPKGQPSPLHRHLFDQVGTYYQAGGRAITPLNGTRNESTTPVGNISTTRKGTTHVEEGTTDPPLRAVFIEMKADTPSTPGAAGSVVPPWTGARQVHAEDRVTVWDFTWSSHAAATSRYERETVVVWLTSGTLRVRADRQQPEVVSVRPGTYWYRAAGSVETEELIDGSPRAIIFEFR